MTLPLAIFSSFTGAFDFILHPREAVTGGGVQVGGPEYVWHFARTQLEVTVIALALSLAIALPIGLVLGHLGKGEVLAVGFGNAGRAVPEIVVILLLAAVIGIGLRNVAIALMILGLPPILTNTYVALRQVDPTAVDAARGTGMNGAQVITRVELPLAAPTIMSGVRTSAINIFATATIASFVGLSTLGDLVTGRNVYGDDGVVAGAIVIALLAMAIELALAGVQRLVTPRGLKLQRMRQGA
ncbi:MAG TPA: ABC transporter permease [Solirubrobacterales bacterium]|jgi:osmoprotectant transport system permease protein